MASLSEYLIVWNISQREFAEVKGFLVKFKIQLCCNSRTFLDVDECTVPGICDAAAQCHNTNGSFSCVCKTGYVGNGFKCMVNTNIKGGELHSKIYTCYLSFDPFIP